MDAKINEEKYNKEGLSEQEVVEKRKQFGFNIIPMGSGFSWFLTLASQFKSPLIYILFFVALISALFGDLIDVVLILSVAVLNVIMGFYQEYSAQKTLKALRSFLKSMALAVRGGERKKIDQKDLVPGDLVLLGEGDKVPADGFLIEGQGLLVNEAVLTGEAEAVAKDLSQKQRRLFMGSLVVSGMGLMRVEKIGLATEIGKISHTLSILKEEKTPFQKKLEIFSRNLALIILIVCCLVFLAGIIFSEVSLWKMFQVAIILSVAAIPEGLPIAMTVIMALGMRRILKRQGLVKKMVSLEALGSVSVILTDKTGTLTEGIMRVMETDFSNQEQAFLTLTLVNNQRDSLENAIWQYLKEKSITGPQEIFSQWPRIFHEPFNSEKKYALTINQNTSGYLACLLGAPEIILSFCSLALTEKEKVLAKIDDYASLGLRVIGVAQKEGQEINILKDKTNFTWLGFCAIEDPLRESALEAIKKAQLAGIEVKIVTGDYQKTAESIAKKLGLKTGKENILSGQDLEGISDEDLQKNIGKVSVFFRVSPHQKLKIVQALKSGGESVAMVGDGVNDALALKMADVGIVVGGATDVAKETSDLILLDGSFKTIIASIEEGRLAFSNIKKVVAYVLSNSFVEIVLIFGALLLKLPSPLIVAQILWLHLICDGPPDIALSFEKRDGFLMQKKPSDMAKEQILSKAMKFLIVGISLMVGGMALLIFWYLFSQQGNLDLARTVAFLVVGAVDLIYVFSFKNLEKPFFKVERFFANKWLLLSSVYGFGLLLAGTYISFLNKVLGTVPLPAKYWPLVFGVGILAVVLVEIVKFSAKRLKIS